MILSQYHIFELDTINIYSVQYIKSTTVYVPSSELGLSQPLSRQRVCPSPPNRGGGVGDGHTCLRVRGWGSPNSDDWRKSLALCLLCGEDTALLAVVLLGPPFSHQR
jgi:hypothetical protein